MTPILLACALTVLIETSLLALWGYRGKRELAVILCANVLTNLLLNLSFLLGLPYVPLWIVLGELCVLAAEYAIYARAFGPGRRLLVLTFLANCLSFGLGLLIL